MIITVRMVRDTVYFLKRASVLDVVNRMHLAHDNASISLVQAYIDTLVADKVLTKRINGYSVSKGVMIYG